MSEERDLKWYVVHTYSGHENKVKTTIENTVKNRGMEDIIEQWARQRERKDISREAVMP